MRRWLGRLRPVQQAPAFERLVPLCADARSPSASARPRVFVVDDAPLVRLSIRRILVVAGYDVVEFSDGQAVLDAVAGGPPDLVLCDASMPGVGGLEALRRLRAGGSTLPFVLMGTMDRALAAEAGESSATAVLAKPAWPELLPEAVATFAPTGPSGDG